MSLSEESSEVNYAGGVSFCCLFLFVFNFLSFEVRMVFYVFLVHGQPTDSLPVGRDIYFLFTVEL